VRDGIAFARRGVPVVALVTEDFWPQGNFVARAFGMPEVPRVELPHPVAGTGDEAMRRVATAIVPRILAALRGEARGEILVAMGAGAEAPGA
jgi:hypothetical protein